MNSSKQMTPHAQPPVNLQHRQRPEVTPSWRERNTEPCRSIVHLSSFVCTLCIFSFEPFCGEATDPFYDRFFGCCKLVPIFEFPLASSRIYYFIVNLELVYSTRYLHDTGTVLWVFPHFVYHRERKICLYETVHLYKLPQFLWDPSDWRATSHT